MHNKKMKGPCECKETCHWRGVDCRSVYLPDKCRTRHRQYKSSYLSTDTHLGGQNRYGFRRFILMLQTADSW